MKTQDEATQDDALTSPVHAGDGNGGSRHDELDLDAIASRLVTARKLTGLRQTDVGAIIGVDRKTIGLWESGKRLPQSKLPALADLYGRSTTWIMTGREGVTEEIAALRDDLGKIMATLDQLATRTEHLAVLFRAYLEAQAADAAPDADAGPGD